MSVKGKVVVITGASSGIGEATAKLLANNGAMVMLGARREDRLYKIADEINVNGGRADFRTVDVTKPEEVEALVKAAQYSFGKVDVIFNNAGIMPNSPMSAVRTDEWNKMIDVNINGVLNGIAAVMPIFTAQKNGHIITTSSIAGLKNYVGSGVYGATKFAVKNAMEVTRMESANEGTNIRTTTLYPAAINTELLDHIGDEKTASNMKNFYKQHGISPDAIARVVNFAIDQPEDVDISEFTICPTNQA
ncbi:SDR family oxidoreductase [Apilactobacillus kunkeei]|uniref:2-hydroxycyclohexanecarboxyl-CoA dehydrogenase n=1 Tax=Apilactobacillus kunkeei TaxID=148814 RepID=A0A0N8IIC0_9LACO|nr:SDR family oxidoreductase [Apilactobacillus kunkeei]KPN84175.1 2-hydroxycyclohexanecarboxyl-CoA dehydrogenase [Apilactobacillus kunkeei]